MRKGNWTSSLEGVAGSSLGGNEKAGVSCFDFSPTFPRHTQSGSISQKLWDLIWDSKSVREKDSKHKNGRHSQHTHTNLMERRIQVSKSILRFFSPVCHSLGQLLW